MAITTVVNAAYDTSGNGGRKVVGLSNGWLIAGVYNSSVNMIHLYKSSDNGITWASLTSFGGVNVALVSNGTNIYALSRYNNIYVQFRTIDGLTGTVIQNLQIEETTALGEVSLAINAAGTELHAAWASKNATYPNSFNIRYAKGTIDGSGNVTWGSVVQVTQANSTTQHLKNPSIVEKNGIPHIIVETQDGSSYSIFDFTTAFTTKTWSTLTTASGWGNKEIYSGGSYAQSSPCAVTDGNGVIHVVWHGMDSVDQSQFAIRYAKSTDVGATWSSSQKIVSTSNLDNQRDPVISVDKNNKLYVLWQGRDRNSVGGATIYQLRKITYDGSSWSTITNLTANTTTPNRSTINPSIMSTEKNSMIGWIYRDDPTSSVKFDSITLNTPPTLSLTSPADNQTLVEGTTVYKSDKTDFLLRILADDSDELDTIEYSVSLRNVTRTPYTNCDKGVAFDYTIPFSELLMGNNTVTVKVKDNNGAETTRNFTIRRTAPDTLSLKSVYDTMISFA